MEAFAHVLQAGRIYEYREDGTVWVKSFGEEYRKYASKKEGVDLSLWLKTKKERIATMEEWRTVAEDFPSLRQLKKWDNDGVSKTPSGWTVEPDGYGPDGSPSWLIILGWV